MSSRLAHALVFIASAAVLVLEILAGRLLAPYVGVTLETFTAIIGVVLAGIAVGTWQGGRLADRQDPRPLLPLAFGVGGALAIVSVPLVRIAGEANLGNGSAAVVALTTVVFFLPSAVLSSISPMVVKLRLRSVEHTGEVVGRLSAVGTVGSLTGVFVTGFVFVARFPITPIVVGVGAGLVVLGLALWSGQRGAVPTERMMGCVALAVAAGALTVITPTVCDEDTTYYCASVEVDPLRPSGRTLYLDDQSHSYVDLTDPTYLGFGYTRMLADVLDGMAPAGEPLDTVHLGGGGFTMPRYLAATRPGSTSLVLEVDPGVVDLARRELGLGPLRGLTTLTGDGRVLLQDTPDGSADIVIGDAFGSETVPWHLTTREFTADVARVLRPDGIYALNLIDHPPLRFLGAEIATLQDVFAHVTVISTAERLRGDDGGNYVLIASDDELPAAAMRDAIARRGDDHAIATADELQRLRADAQVLTDERAPVDQLHTP